MENTNQNGSSNFVSPPKGLLKGKKNLYLGLACVLAVMVVLYFVLIQTKQVKTTAQQKMEILQKIADASSAPVDPIVKKSVLNTMAKANTNTKISAPDTQAKKNVLDLIANASK